MNKAGKLKIYNLILFIYLYLKLIFNSSDKLKIRAVNSSKSLLRVIKNPVTSHLPHGTNFFHFSNEGLLKSSDSLFSENWEELDEFAVIIPTCVKNQTASHGMDLNAENVKISSFGLTSSALSARLMVAGERHLKIE